MNNPGQLPSEEEKGTTHPSVQYERSDVNPQVILIALVALGGVTVAALVILWPLYGYLSSRGTGGTPSVSPGLMVQRSMEPPEPRLQGGPGSPTPPQEELKQMRAEAEAKLNSYGWVDRQNSIARIPVQEAMRLLVETSPSVPGLAASSKMNPSASPGPSAKGYSSDKEAIK